MFTFVFQQTHVRWGYATLMVWLGGSVFIEESPSEWISMSPYIEIKAEGRNATWIPVAILLSQELWTLGKKCKNCVKSITLKIALMYWLLSFCLSIGLQKNLKKTWMLVLRGSKARQVLGRQHPPWHPGPGRSEWQEWVMVALRVEHSSWRERWKKGISSRD